MDFDFDKDEGINELQDELNVEVPEAKAISKEENNDSFDETGRVIMEEEEVDNENDIEKILLGDQKSEEEPVVEKLKSKDIANFFGLANNMLANTISQITGKEISRYSIDKETTKTVADAYVKAFPTAVMSPKTTFFFILFMALLPLMTNVYTDIKEVNNEPKTNEDNNNSGNERNGQNNNAKIIGEKH